MRKLVSGIVTMLLLMAFPAQAFADAAGSALGVDPAANAELDSTTRTLVVGADIFLGDLVETGPKGQVQILFADKTKLVVGPRSSLAIQDYLIRNDGSAGKFVVDMLSGTFRFATGDAPKDKYEIDTPTGTIGVRGTEFEVFVDLDGVTRILHHKGIVLFKAKAEKHFKQLTNNCDLGQISKESSLLGNSRAVKGAARTQLKHEFIYSENQSPLLRRFWMANALECLRNPPDVVVVVEGPHNHGTPKPPVEKPPVIEPPVITPAPPPGCPIVRGC